MLFPSKELMAVRRSCAVSTNHIHHFEAGAGRGVAGVLRGPVPKENSPLDSLPGEDVVTFKGPLTQELPKQEPLHHALCSTTVLQSTALSLCFL